MNISPPNWAKNAIPTKQGWVNPKTGELLVSKRGLLDNIQKGSKTVNPVEKTPTVIIETQPKPRPRRKKKDVE